MVEIGLVVAVAVLGFLALTLFGVCLYARKFTTDVPVLDQKIETLKGNTEGWLVPYKELKLGRLLGKGSQGEVYQAEWRGTTIAVKKVDIRHVGQDIIEEFCAEADIMRRLRHPSLCLFMGVCLEHPHLCILTECVSRGSLFDILHDECIPISWNLILRMSIDMAEGMNYLHMHKPPILHRDLKSLNLLVDENWKIKIVDFGMTRFRDANATMTQCGSPLWMAPEMIRNQPYDEKVDVYSYAICLWELYTRRIPYRNLDLTPHVLVSKVVKENLRPPIPKHCPPPFAKLMRDCWAPDPAQRPTFVEILKALHQIKEDGVVPVTNPRKALAEEKKEEVKEAKKEKKEEEKKEEKKSAPRDESWKVEFKEVTLGPEFGHGLGNEFVEANWRGKTVCVRRWPVKQGLQLRAALAAKNAKNPNPQAAHISRLMDRLANLRHPNVALFMGAYFADNEVGVLTEHLARGTLASVLADPSASVEWDVQVQMLLDVALGMSFLHGSDPPIVHRGLCSRSLLVDHNMRVKLMDHLSDDLRSGFQLPSVPSPNPFVPPEAKLNAALAVSIDADIFNFGTVCWEVLTRQDVSMGGGQQPVIPKALGKDFISLIEQCWNPEPPKRPRLQQIVAKLEAIKKEGPPRVHLSLGNARKYQKKKTILAFRSKDPVTIVKYWGKSYCKPNAWVIVSDNDDIYCCDDDVFMRTYEPVGPQLPNHYRKTGFILGKRMNEPFSVKTGSGSIEHGNAGDYLVQNETNEQWPIEGRVFQELYEEC